jgi:hypothetical protein
MRFRWAFVLFQACSTPTSTYEGKLIDPWTGKGREGVRVVGKAPADVADAACQVTEGTSGADGVFRLEGVCTGVTYTLHLMDPKLFAPELPTVTGGASSAGAQEIAAWRIPGSTGVFLLGDNDEMAQLRTNAPVEGAWIQGTEKKEVALYPTSVPETVPVVSAGTALVLSGQATVERLKFYPLIAHPGALALELASGSKMNVSDAWYLGLEFKSDTEFTKVPAPVDQAKVKTVGSGAEVLQVYPSEALPPGRYALIGDDDSRMYIVDFGASLPATAAATPPAK